MKPKIGWMDSTVLFSELGDKPTVEIHSDEVTCKLLHPCIDKSEQEHTAHRCYATKVYVFDAELYDRAFGSPLETENPSQPSGQEG